MKIIQNITYKHNVLTTITNYVSMQESIAVNKNEFRVLLLVDKLLEQGFKHDLGQYRKIVEIETNYDYTRARQLVDDMTKLLIQNTKG